MIDGAELQGVLAGGIGLDNVSRNIFSGIGPSVNVNLLSLALLVVRDVR